MSNMKPAPSPRHSGLIAQRAGGSARRNTCSISTSPATGTARSTQKARRKEAWKPSGEKSRPAPAPQRAEHRLQAPQDADPGEEKNEHRPRPSRARDDYAEENRRLRAPAPAHPEVQRDGEERRCGEAIAENGGVAQVAHLRLSASRSGTERSRPSAEARSGRGDRKSTRLNSSHVSESRMPSS